jgi:hypothetical protein
LTKDEGKIQFTVFSIVLEVLDFAWSNILETCISKVTIFRCDCFSSILKVILITKLYLYPNTIRQVKSRRMGWAGNVACMGEERKLYKVLVESLKERPLRRPRHRWQDCIRMDFRQIGWEGVE